MGAAAYSAFCVMPHKWICSPYFTVTGTHPYSPLDIVEANFLLPTRFHYSDNRPYPGLSSAGQSRFRSALFGSTNACTGPGTTPRSDSKKNIPPQSRSPTSKKKPKPSIGRCSYISVPDNPEAPNAARSTDSDADSSDDASESRRGSVTDFRALSREDAPQITERYPAE